MNHLIGLTGNMGVGKSTLGPKIAEYLKAIWLPETEIALLFPNVVSNQEGHSKLIGELAFASTRCCAIISHFLAGAKVVVSERSIWEDRLFYGFWRDYFDLYEYDMLVQDFFDILSQHPTTYTLHTVLLTADVSTLVQRVKERNEPYDHAFDEEIIGKLQEAVYDKLLRHPPEHIIHQIDVSNIDIRKDDVAEYIVREIINKLKLVAPEVFS